MLVTAVRFAVRGSAARASMRTRLGRDRGRVANQALSIGGLQPGIAHQTRDKRHPKRFLRVDAVSLNDPLGIDKLVYRTPKPTPLSP